MSKHHRSYVLDRLECALASALQRKDSYEVGDLRLRIAIFEGAEGLDVEAIARRLAEAEANGWTSAAETLRTALVCEAQPRDHEQLRTASLVRCRPHGEAVPREWLASSRMSWARRAQK